MVENIKEVAPESAFIDPQVALEILPQKIAERRRLVTSIALDISIARECDAPDIGELEKSLEAQVGFMQAYENRLEAVKRAISGD